MNDTTVYVGLDVRRDTTTAACVGPEPEAPVTDLGTLDIQQYAIDRILKKLPGHSKLVDEAGPCGFWLRRYLTAKGLDRVVTAPSLIPKKPHHRDPRPGRRRRHPRIAWRAQLRLHHQYRKLTARDKHRVLPFAPRIDFSVCLLTAADHTLDTCPKGSSAASVARCRPWRNKARSHGRVRMKDGAPRGR